MKFVRMKTPDAVELSKIVAVSVECENGHDISAFVHTDGSGKFLFGTGTINTGSSEPLHAQLKRARDETVETLEGMAR